MNANVLKRAESFARSFHEGDASGHDWTHIERVVRMTRTIAAAEKADPFICELAALLHDVADPKLNDSKEAGIAGVRGFLDSLPIPADAADHVIAIIATMSYSEGPGRPMATAEGRVVRDADRLDAIGAIGIARTFAYAGWKGHPLHDAVLAPRQTWTQESYHRERSTAINHFYEKLLKLKSLLHTETARKIADERHRFMESYLEQFHKEWSGNG